MTAEAAAWHTGSFAVDVQRQADGSTVLTPRATLGAYPRRVTDALEHWAALAPDRIFVARRRADGAWQRLSYRQALQRVRALASGLATHALSAQRPLVILSGNGIEHLLLGLSAMYLGVPYCPMSPAYSHRGSDFSKLRYVMGLLTPGMVAAFDTPQFEQAIAAAVPLDAVLLGDAGLSSGRAVHRLETLESGDLEGVEAAHARVEPDTIAKLLLTSGSTGQPKAVVTTHRMLCSNQIMLHSAMPFLLDEPPIVVDWLPWNHTYGGSHNVGAVLFNGGSLYIDDGRPIGQAFQETVRNLSEISPTVYFNVPKGFEMLVERMEHDETLRCSFFRRLRACFFAGASLSQYTWDAMDRQAMSARGRRLPMLSGLGATETSPSVTFTTPETDRAGVIGLPAPGCVVKIAPVADKLELRVRGPNVTPGYWRAPEQTAAAFDEQGYYRLGDAVRLLDPEDPTRGLAFDGRISEDFKLSTGTWVSVGPLRASLLQALAPLALDVVIAGLDRDYLTLLILPDVRVCSLAIGAAQPLSPAELAREPRLLQQLAERLAAHARTQSGSATRVRRALVLPEPPSRDRGEITDKGSINQRLMRERWAALIAELYRDTVPAHAVCVV